MQEFFNPRNMSILRWRTSIISCNFHNRKWWTRGFTLAELIVVIAIVGMLSIIGLSLYKHFIDKARNTRAVAEIRMYEREITNFLDDAERLPDALVELGLEVPQDPWKNPYQYINFDTSPGAKDKRRTKGAKGKGKGKGSPLNSDYDLYSMGKDRMSDPVITDATSMDDIIRADDGGYTGLASEY
jgi:general secretion pathway protein G